MNIIKREKENMERNFKGDKMRENRITKVWGTRDRIFKSKQCEIDFLELRGNSQCSVHTHKNKVNKFIVIDGTVTIKTGFGDILLYEGDRITVEPPLVHQFKTGEYDARMIEIAYVDEGEIDPEDIERSIQGGRTVEGKEYTLEEMQEKNMTDMIKGE